jgi:dihydrofolate reductase
MASDTLLLGRRTYEGFAAAWPGRTDETGFADKMNSMRKVVVSSTLTDPEWSNTMVLDGDLSAGVAALKQEQGGDILVAGSGRLVRHLAAEGHVDEYRLMVFPIVLGAGQRLFDQTARSIPLEVVSAQVGGAVQMLVLRPASS